MLPFFGAIKHDRATTNYVSVGGLFNGNNREQPGKAKAYMEP